MHARRHYSYSKSKFSIYLDNIVRQEKQCQTQEIPNLLNIVFLNREDVEIFGSKMLFFITEWMNEFFIERTKDEDEGWPFHEEKQKRKKNIAKDQGTKASGALSTLCSLIFSYFFFLFTLSKEGQKSIRPCSKQLRKQS